MFGRSIFSGPRSPWASHIQKAQRVTTRPPKSLERVCTRPVYVGYHLSLLSNVSIWQLDFTITKSVVIAPATGVSSIRLGFPNGCAKTWKNSSIRGDPKNENPSSAGHASRRRSLQAPSDQSVRPTQFADGGRIAQTGVITRSVTSNSKKGRQKYV